jgi:hypothetical protein
VTPVPLDLPLRPAEAAEIANLIFDHAERKPLTDELRNRLGARAAAMKLETITPYFGSLERDPVHPSAYYLAVDGLSSPQLLYMALATAPTSSIYHKPLLIGRVRRLNGPEMVINATPFGPQDRESVEQFASRINSAFYPQPQGARSTITVSQDHAAAFAVYRSIHKRSGRNVAALAGDYHAALWSAIRAGWRVGYTICGDLTEVACSRFRLTVPATDAGLKAAEESHEQIRRARVERRIARGFDFELVFEPPVGPEDLRRALERLREGAHMPQLVGAATSEIDAVAAIARQFQVTLSFSYAPGNDHEVDAVARATAGRVNYNVHTAEEAELVAARLL